MSKFLGQVSPEPPCIYNLSALAWCQGNAGSQKHLWIEQKGPLGAMPSPPPAPLRPLPPGRAPGLPVTVLWEGSLGAQCTWDGTEKGTCLLLGHVPGRWFQGSTAPSGLAPPPCKRVSCIWWRRARGPRQYWESLRGSLLSCVQVQGHTPHVAPHPGHAVFAQAWATCRAGGLWGGVLSPEMEWSW